MRALGPLTVTILSIAITNIFSLMDPPTSAPVVGTIPRGAARPQQQGWKKAEGLQCSSAWADDGWLQGIVFGSSSLQARKHIITSVGECWIREGEKERPQQRHCLSGRATALL
jgi:hypothetical protein